ncbi:MAG: sugar epimerase [Candidatus Marinimicrobia bacterium]|nr:sugar epimerase [Candidatus Neomarinimicrobiota bacterium]|tara:strand:+ start:30369 stop:30806 length:438 start_codon:yes stop_codon:yes gene_type:complete
MELKQIDGGIHIDERGTVSFVNDFQFDQVKRFYTVRNHRSPFIRAWHGHKKEGKYVTVVNGSAIIGAIKIENWDNPSENKDISKFVLSSTKPSILSIPSGYANGMMTLEKDTIIMVFSTSSLEESLKDDIRFDSKQWDIWEIKEK